MSPLKFVRGKGQLALYREEWNQTGHLLTASEALAAYGREILQEAEEYGSAVILRHPRVIEKTLRSRRHDLGLSCRAVARSSGVSEHQVVQAEDNAAFVSVGDLEKIAFSLGLDERLLAVDEHAGGDPSLAVRLKTMQAESPGLALETFSEKTVTIFAEAASIIRVQIRLQRWLNLTPRVEEFATSNDYGSPNNPAWKIGYRLAAVVRGQLGLEDLPIRSMRDLVEGVLGIPVVQARLPAHVAGATVATSVRNGGETRGIVLNTQGSNQNVWVRRATLAHEVAHLLFDSEHHLQKVLVDSYEVGNEDPETGWANYIEQRANAFAIAFLAPPEAIRQMISVPVSQEAVGTIMTTFGISHTAARYHIGNALYRNYDVPDEIHGVGPSDDQKALEDYTLDYFQPETTPIQRRGKFAGVVAQAFEGDLISRETAAEYLNCSVDDFLEYKDVIRSLFTSESDGTAST